MANMTTWTKAKLRAEQTKLNRWLNAHPAAPESQINIASKKLDQIALILAERTTQISHLNDEQVLERLKILFADPMTVNVTIPFREYYLLHEGLRSVERSGISDLQKRQLAAILKQMQSLILAAHPEAQPCLDGTVTTLEGFAETLTQVMSDSTPTIVNFTLKDVWNLVAWIQVLVRHPQAPSVDFYFHMGKQFQGAVEENYPDLGVILDQGWNPAYDR